MTNVNENGCKDAQGKQSAGTHCYVDGSLEISTLVECPCGEIINLFEMQPLIEDGYLYEHLLSDKGWGKQDFGEIIQCPGCKKEITVRNIEW